MIPDLSFDESRRYAILNCQFVHVVVVDNFTAYPMSQAIGWSEEFCRESSVANLTFGVCLGKQCVTAGGKHNFRQSAAKLKLSGVFILSQSPESESRIFEVLGNHRIDQIGPNESLLALRDFFNRPNICLKCLCNSRQGRKRVVLVHIQNPPQLTGRGVSNIPWICPVHGFPEIIPVEKFQASRLNPVEILCLG